MASFILRRLIQSGIVLLAVAMIAFLMFRFIGDPVSQMVGQETTLAERAELREKLGLNDPVPVQFLRFVGRAATGNFGISYQMGQPVDRLLAERLPATLELSVFAMIIACLIGVPLGVYTGLHPKRWLSRLFLVVSLIGISLPTFFTGIMLILVFGVELGLLSTFGRGETTQIGWWTTGLLSVSGWKSIIMPAFTLGLFQMTFIMRLIRSEMMEVMRTDFIKFARARGISEGKINFGHALRNTLVPVMTIVGMQLGSIIAFGIITESVFQWPGVGLLFLQAISTADIPIMSTYLLLVAVLFVVINLTVDLLYYVIDPRLRADNVARGA